jgi:hypothetical protein
MNNRLNPWSSRTGIVLTIILLGGLGFSLWKDRGMAFSPGTLTAKQQQGVILQGFQAHADFEKECRYCHVPLEATVGEMCLTCHAEIANQVKSGEGIHAQIENVHRCYVCHSDHQGRDFDPTLAAIDSFDHSFTQFSLLHHQENYAGTPMACSACHNLEDYSAVADSSCQDCHGSYDREFLTVHSKDYGENCLGCHDGIDRMRAFDHDKTGFALDGQHAQVTCGACHASDLISVTKTSCQGCHAEPEVHRGMFEQTCANCHSTQGWSPASLAGQLFNHLVNTGFALDRHWVDYGGQPLLCSSCHQVNLQIFDQQLCVDCHTQADLVFMEGHQRQFGADCLGCHDGVDRMHGFDHGTVFPLEGQHAEISCSECHTDQVFVGTPTVCAQCHAEPDIHAGVFGLACESCHTTTAWSPATLLEHTFPLGHGLETGAQPTVCITCHPASYPEYTCYGCHEHQESDIARKHTEEGISMAELPACVDCHTSGQKVDNND